MKQKQGAAPESVLFTQSPKSPKDLRSGPERVQVTFAFISRPIKGSRLIFDWIKELDSLRESFFTNSNYCETESEM